MTSFAHETSHEMKSKSEQQLALARHMIQEYRVLNSLSELIYQISEKN